MRVRSAAWALVVVGLCAARPALAGPSGDEAQRKKLARQLADRAYELYTAGDYTRAIEAFKVADETYHAPTLVYALAKAHVKARHLLAARALLDKLSAEKLPADAPEAFIVAQSSAKEDVKAVIAAIPTLEVRLRGAVASVTVTIDGAPATPGARTELDPGKHEVTVSHDGARETRSVGLAEGAHESMDIDLGAAPVAPPVAAQVAEPLAPRAPSAAPGAIALSLGGAGLVVGAVAGVVTLRQASDIKAHCPGGVCPLDEKPKVATANTLSAVSTAGFVTAGVGVVVGVVLLARRAQAARPAVNAFVVGPGSLALRGAF
jgi:hypothetical protein